MLSDIINLLLIVSIIILVEKNRRIKNKYNSLEVIFNDVGELVCFKDHNGRIINANLGFFKMFDIDKSFLGMNINEIVKIKPEKKVPLEICHKTDVETIESKKTLVFEQILEVENGNFKTFKVVKTPVYDEDSSFIGIVMVSRDITDKIKMKKFKQLAKEREKNLIELKHYNDVKTEFFANLSHEFRTPLNIILSAIKMKEIYVEEYKETGSMNWEKQIYYNSFIKQNTLRIIKLVNNIIDTSRYDAKHLECNLENGNIVDFIENIVMSVSTITDSMGLNLIFDTDVEECEMAFDFNKIERVILNLLSNSVKFTDRGGEILVSLFEKDTTFEIYVSDTGIGIPMEKREFIFERFFQVDKSMTRNREGSGIGLSLVKAFIDVQGGTIELLEEQTKGTIFKIILDKKIIDEENKMKNINQKANVEIINIEFSDIYK